jgi:Uncharacterised nucleotidyltransferase
MTPRYERSTSWPNPAQTLLLRAALLEGDPARHAWQHWQASIDVEHLDEGSFRLLPLLYGNLTRLEVRSPWLARFRGVHRQSWYRNQLLFRRTAGTLRALAAAGIETIVLKGVPLALEHYRDEAVRPMGDADVLVRPADTVAAVEVLARCGWRPRIDPGRWPVEPRASWSLVDAEGRELDLHWRVFAECFSGDDALWSAAVPLDVHGAPTRALAPPEQLLHVLVHGLQWSPIPSIRWAADAAAVLRTAGDQFDWPRLFDLADTRRFRVLLDLGLGWLSRGLGIDLPEAVVAGLAARPLTLRQRTALGARMSQGPVSAAWRLWADYRRSIEGTRVRATPVGYWHYLRARWVVDERGSLPAIMAQKIGNRLRRA